LYRSVGVVRNGVAVGPSVLDWGSYVHRGGCRADLLNGRALFGPESLGTRSDHLRNLRSRALILRPAARRRPSRKNGRIRLRYFLTYSLTVPYSPLQSLTRRRWCFPPFLILRGLWGRGA